MKKHFTLTAFITAICIAGSLSIHAQRPVTERDVRAEMYFLAGDAMQGRGSGTPFERVAAEYIGSQFMQFGLEPVGDNGFDGKPTFVQTVDVAGRSVLKDLKFGGDLADKIVLNKDLIVFAITSANISGPVQRAKLTDKAKPGAVILLDLGDETKFEDVQSQVQQFTKDGAAAIMMVENKEIREHWNEIASRPAQMGRRGGSLFAVSRAALDTLSARDGSTVSLSGSFQEGTKTHTWNAIGKITGSDPALGSQVILLSSHLDHLGVRDSNPGDDKIFNGADDDASGSIAVLEMARLLGSGKRPKRTVYFVCFGSEEAGGFGANYFVNNLPFPKDKLVANLEFEMIGRPDDKVKPDELWLTGYERSNLGPELARRGARLVQDPRPDQNFFQRSDNYTLARQGIIAHTVSSFGLHADYHHASDEIKTIDFAHMTKSINSMVKPVQWLVNSPFVPAWNEGKKP